MTGTQAAAALQARGNRTLGDAIAEFLEHCGVTAAFGVISIHNMPILDAIGRRGRIAFVPSRGEAGAVNMADAYARVSGHLGVAVTSTGTAAGNAAGAMVEALTAGSPVLHLTGQVRSDCVDRNRAYIHDAPAQLQMLRAVSKAAYRINETSQAERVLREAVSQALTPPMGPVSIEIPIDVQGSAFGELSGAGMPEPHFKAPEESDVEAVARALESARRPVMLLGGGARRAVEPARRLADLGVAVVTSVNGRGIVPEGHPMSLGPIGPNRTVEELYETCDLMLIVGSRLRSNETWDYELRLPARRIVINCDPAADGCNYSNDRFVCADSRLFLERLVERVAGRLSIDPGLARHVADVRTTWEQALRDDLGPYAGFVDVLQEHMPEDAVWVRDVTLSNSLWGNRLLKIRKPSNAVHAVGGGIGQGLPMAVGAAAAAKGRKVVALCGDGGLSLSLGELITAAQERSNVTVLLMNDGGYGVIRNIQDAHYGGRRYFSTITTPHFGKISESLDIPHFEVSSLDQFRTYLPECLAIEGLSVLEVRMERIGTFKRKFTGPPTRS